MRDTGDEIHRWSEDDVTYDLDAGGAITAWRGPSEAELPGERLEPTVCSRELARVVSERRWTAARDRLPEARHYVLIFNPASGPAMVEAMFDDRWRESDVFGRLPVARDRDLVDYVFSHWLPLPAPPGVRTW
jgi:hypothetical protein